LPYLFLPSSSFLEFFDTVDYKTSELKFPAVAASLLKACRYTRTTRDAPLVDVLNPSPWLFSLKLALNLPVLTVPSCQKTKYRALHIACSRPAFSAPLAGPFAHPAPCHVSSLTRRQEGLCTLHSRPSPFYRVVPPPFPLGWPEDQVK